ncbi:MAG: hypothetical protein QM811_24080 [Pirellulales bacterium]
MFAGGDFGQALRDAARFDVREIEALATRQDRDRNLVDFGRAEDEFDVRRRLFQRF